MVTGERDDELGFLRDYPDPRTAPQRATDQRAVARQSAALTRQQKDSSLEREFVSALSRRRAERSEVLQFDVVGGRAAGRGRTTLIVRGELLADAAGLEAAGVRDRLDRLGFTWEPIECLEGRVGRLVNAGTAAERLVDVARMLRRAGVAASVNHITPLGPIMKGGNCGAEQSEASVSFPPAFATKTAARVPVAVIDTGITSQSRADGWLSSVTRDGNIDLLDDLPTADGFLDLGAGHGTFAAGVLQQVAPDADLRVYKALDSDGVGSEVAVACAMVRAVDEGARIISLSLGVQTIDDQPPVAIAAALDIITERTKGEVLVVAAAGNDGSTRPCWPAAFRSVVSVAGLTADLRATEWSNRGFWITCSTVGEGVLSAYPEGIESPEFDLQPDAFPADGWAVWTGTSFAAPQVAGAVARLAAQNGSTPREALRTLLAAGRAVPDFGIALRILPGT